MCVCYAHIPVSRSPGNFYSGAWYLPFICKLLAACPVYGAENFEVASRLLGSLWTPAPRTTLPDVLTVYILHAVTSQTTRVFSNAPVTSYPTNIRACSVVFWYGALCALSVHEDVCGKVPVNFAGSLTFVCGRRNEGHNSIAWRRDLLLKPLLSQALWVTKSRGLCLRNSREEGVI